jgi:hypothetical protein
MPQVDLAGRVADRAPYLERSEAVELLRAIDDSDRLEIFRHEKRKKPKAISDVVLHLVAWVTDFHISTAETVIRIIQEDGHHEVRTLNPEPRITKDDPRTTSDSPVGKAKKKRQEAIADLNSQTTSVRSIPSGAFETRRSRH